MFDIQTREIEAQQVLTEVRFGTNKGLSRWLGSAIGRGWKRAPAYGGVIGPVFVVIHGKLGPDDYATVEVCIPVAMGQDIPKTEPHRIEPAHTEAFTRITKKQVKLPQILDAYAAVEEWVETNTRTFILAPREVYFNDFMHAAPDDETTDIAYPIS